MRGTCVFCGRQWDTDLDSAAAESYYFSSLTYPKGSYVTAARILALGEAILTCPLDGSVDRGALGYAADSFTPSGGSMNTGDDRYTEGDETETIEAPRHTPSTISDPKMRP